MALITDPDDLVVGNEIVIDPATSTIRLIGVGNLSDDGVTLQAVYSKVKEKWVDGTYLQYRFPLLSITEEKYEVINGWTWFDNTTISYLRNGGFAIRNLSGSIVAEYVNIVTLGDIEPGGTVYHQQEVGGPAVSFGRPGPVNECLQIFGDANNGNFDYRSFLKIFIREQAKTYDAAAIGDIGISRMSYQSYRFPLQNDQDTKITHSDTTVDNYGVSIAYYDSAQSRDLGSAGVHAFNTIIDGAQRTNDEIYEAVQSLLRKDENINQGLNTVIGKTADELMYFVGDILNTNESVFIDNLQVAERNFVEFRNSNNIITKYPYVATGIMSFDSDLVADTSGKFMMFYDDGNWGSDTALKVRDASGSFIQGSITGGDISFTYDFDYDSDGGFAGTEKNIKLVASGLESGQYVNVDYTITRSVTNNIEVDARQELNYKA